MRRTGTWLTIAVAVLALLVPRAPRARAQSPEEEIVAGEEEAEAQDVEEAAEEAGDPGAVRAARRRAQSIEEIVVTAQKREQNIQDVPISMTALTSDFILDAGLTRFDALGQFAPNLSINSVGDTRGTAIRIRGIGSDQTNAGIDSSVGVFIDGIYQGRTGLAATSDLVDIERIEVLRGPQGTLYGKNTAAGAINVWSKKPSLEGYEGLVEASYGNYNLRELRGSINAPLVEDLVAARLTGYIGRRDYFDEVVGGGGRNDSDRNGARLRTLLTPTDDFELIVSADYATSQSACCAFDIVTFDGPPNLDVTFGTYPPPPGFVIGSLAESTGRPLPKADPFDRVLDANEATTDDTQSWGVSIEGNYDLAEHTVKLLAAHRRFKSISLLDGDFSSYDAVFLSTDEKFKQWSTELQLISPTGERLEYVLGLYFYYSKDDTKGKLGIGPEWIAASPILGPPIGLGADENGDAFNKDTNAHETWSYAFFGQSTYDITDSWSATIGLRGTYERKKRVGSQIATFEADAGPFGPPRYYDQHFGVFDASPLGVLEFHPTDDAMLFGKIAQGFKSGGYNQQRTTGGGNTKFDDEKATDFEVGARTSWFDRMLNANATFFYTLYDDFQAQAFDGSGFIVDNAGSLTSYGVEADVFAVPHEAWQIGGSIGWNVAEYDDFDNAACTAEQSFTARLNTPGGNLAPVPCDQDLSGKRLDNAPRWTANLFTQIEYPLWGLRLLGGPLIGRFRTDYSYRDFIYLQQDLDANLTQGPVHLLNFLVAVGPEDGPWEISMWVRNAIDFRYLVAGVDVPITSGYGGLDGPPRQFGATLRLFF